MRIRTTTPLHILSLLLSAIVVSFITLALAGAPYARTPQTAPQHVVAVADSDSTAAALGLAAAVADSAAADSMAIPPDTGHVARYLPQPSHLLTPPVTHLNGIQRPINLSNPFDKYYTYEIELDSMGRHLIVQKMAGGQAIQVPRTIERSTYQEYRLETGIQENWRRLLEQQALQSQRYRSGFGLNVVIPGAQESAFTTIFGKPQVDLRVNGQASIDLGFDYHKSEQQFSFTGDQGRLNPDFGQEIQLGITGTIGDKLQVNVDWDTEQVFDYQNQLRLEYTGYDDDIVQSVVAGNVQLRTPSQLIQGGQSLFGIRTDLQLGGLSLTTVMSQREGESNELTISGGSQRSTFNLRPTDYDEDTHFFLAYYFHNSWEPALSNPNQILLGPNFQQIIELAVWKRTQRAIAGDNERQVVALVDLGEPDIVRQGSEAYTERQLPHPSLDVYDEATLDRLRDGSQSIDDDLEALGLESSMYETAPFEKLEQGVDYTYNEYLGYISLTSTLDGDEALAVAFRYRRRDGTVVQVGDFPTGGGSTGQTNEDRLVLKLVRPSHPQPSNPAWDLTLRNIYSIPVRGISENSFDLQIQYDKPGTPSQNYLPNITLPNQQTLLQALGLDRINSGGAPSPDNQFDFMPGITVDPGAGRIIFPYLEPFGQRIVELIQNDATRVSGMSKQEAINLLAFNDLYNEKLRNAQRDSQHDVYSITGSVQGSVQSVYNLGFSLVEGSVEVTSGGVLLTPGQDYQVNYATGTITITNRAYLTPGRDVNISYEQNQLVALQKKTLLGVRADYQLRDFLTLGATAMRLSEKAVNDKFRLGREPLSNTIWGVDGSLDLQPRWLTQVVDALPLIQTKAPSSISLKAEFAQLRPGYATTNALERTQRDLAEQGLSLPPDERSGVSFIDDFSGVENTYDLDSPGAWRLSAPPAEINVPGATSDSLRTNHRASFTWYKLPRNLYKFFNLRADNADAVRPIHINEVYPDRSTRGETITSLQTFDIYFDPTKRGPYNYTRDLKGFKNNPQHNWGGITQRMPEGFNDFNLRNIEFVEFIFSPYSKDVNGVAADSAKLYVNLGIISEDVIPNGRLNNEDGLALQNIENDFHDEWGRFPNGVQNSIVNIDEQSNKTEDLGLDGLPSSSKYANYQETEREFFAGFLESVREQFGANSPVYQRIRQDPSADDYHYWRDDDYFSAYYPGGALVQERFGHFFPGTELNSFDAQSTVAGGGTAHVGNTRTPDSEDRNGNSDIDLENSYYSYSIPLSTTRLDNLADPSETDDYIVTKIDGDPVNNQSSEWYLVRIPVRDFEKKVGNINGFSFIESIRLWTTGHRAPITMRFASMQIVGSRWEKSNKVGIQANNDLKETTFTISTVNNHENPNYESPNGTLIRQRRLSTGVTQDAREQSMVLRIQNLAPGDERAIKKTYNDGYNLLKYSNMRMFVHAHSNQGIGFEERGDLTLFVRLGLNSTNDYYVYEQPLTPSQPYSGNPDEVWQTNQRVEGYNQPIDLNSMNIVLSALNRLKVQRDNNNVPVDSLYMPDEEYEFAPPGARLGIKGQPTLSGIKMIMIGIRNPADSTGGQMIKDATVWVNELRVSGFDDEPGWAGLATARIKLADLARINFNMRTQTDRFGDLSSTLATRQQTNTQNWALNSTINLDQFLPERYGWNIPLSYSIRSNRSMPRYSPSRGDIRMEELLTQVKQNQQLSSAEKQATVQQLINGAETESMTRSISIRTNKNNSQSPFLRHTIDALSLSFNHSETQSHSPSTKLDDSWQWSTALNYRLNLRKPYTIEPFGFLDGVWGLDWISSLQFGYLPSSLNMSATANRRFGMSRNRPRFNILRADADSLRLEAYRRFPFRENHQFQHRRTFGLRYNPFGFFGINYNSSVNQNLNATAVDTTFNVATLDTILHDIRWREAVAKGLADSNAVEIERLEVSPIGEVVKGVLQGSSDIRTESYSQSISFSLQPNMSSIGILDWISIQPISYETDFQWRNGPIGQDSTGAGVGSSISLRGDITLNLKEFWRQFEFYRQMEEQQQQDQQPAPAPGDTTAVEDQGGLLGIDLSLPDWSSLLQRTFLALTGIRDINLSYQSRWSTQSSNVKGGFGLVDAFTGAAPSLAYRLGLERTLPLNKRWIGNQRLQVNDDLQSSHTIAAQTSLSPSQQLDISLSADVSWGTNKAISYGLGDRGNVRTTTTSSGSNQATIWGLTGSYKEFFERQLATYRADKQAGDGGGDGTIGDANNDNRIVLTNSSLIEDFTETFVFSSVTLDDHGFLPLPLPNWNVTYTGLGDWPILSWLVNSATLRHGYVSTYSTSYETILAAGTDAQGNPITKSFDLGPDLIEYPLPNIMAGSVRINEKFQPLIGLNLSWKGGFQTGITWSKSHAVALTPDNANVRMNSGSSLTVNANYSKRGLELPFSLPFIEGRTLNNTIRFSLSVSRSTDVSRRYRLKSDLEKKINGLTDDQRFLNPPVRSIRRISIEPRLSYQFSNRVSADFFVRYQHLASKGNRIPANTNISGGFNIRVSISNASSGYGGYGGYRQNMPNNYRQRYGQ